MALSGHYIDIVPVTRVPPAMSAVFQQKDRQALFGHPTTTAIFIVSSVDLAINSVARNDPSRQQRAADATPSRGAFFKIGPLTGLRTINHSSAVGTGNGSGRMERTKVT